MSSDDLVHAYLVGKTTCPLVQQALQDLSASRVRCEQPSPGDPGMMRPSDPCYLVQGQALDDVVTRVFCDQPPADPGIPQSSLCEMVRGVPTLVACQQDRCQILVDGYYDDFVARSAQGLNLFLYGLQ
jgi:hypothetical protein